MFELFRCRVVVFLKIVIPKYSMKMPQLRSLLADLSFLNKKYLWNKFFFCFPILGISFNVLAQASSEQSIQGIWLMANKNVKVNVYQVDSIYRGTVVWMSADANTKNFQLGGTVVDQLRYKPSIHEFTDGYFYGRGIELKCRLKVISEDSMSITVSKGPLKRVKYATRSQL